MPTTRNDVLKESAFETAADWSVSHGKRFRANIIIWGMRKQYSTLFNIYKNKIRNSTGKCMQKTTNNS